MVSLPKTADELLLAENGVDLFLTPEEGRRQFDIAVRRLMGISGDDFISRYEAGEYYGVADEEGSRHIGDLIMLIPFARQDR